MISSIYNAAFGAPSPAPAPEPEIDFTDVGDGFEAIDERPEVSVEHTTKIQGDEDVDEGLQYDME